MMFRLVKQRSSVIPRPGAPAAEEEDQQKRVPLLTGADSASSSSSVDDDEQSVSAADDTGAPLRVVLLGCGDCGKSTLFRQIRTLGVDDVTSELREVRWISIQNLINGTMVVAEEFNTADCSEEVKKAVKSLLGITKKAYISFLSSTLRQNLHTILESEHFLEFARTFSENDLHPSWFALVERFLKDPEVWGSSSWNPMKEDILYAYARTSGVVSIKMKVKSGRTLHISDTGGQRCERRKWVHALEQHLDAVVFVASLADFASELFEDHRQNRLLESLTVFESICKDANFARVPILLVLTKEDALYAKVASGNAIKTCTEFPDMPMGNDAKEIEEYLTGLFLTRSAKYKREIHVSRMSAISTHDVGVFFDDLLRTIDN